jgi:hypothetical protein
VKPLENLPETSLESDVRHAVEGLASCDASPSAGDGSAPSGGGSQPTVVSISDIHGYLDEARSALLTLADHPEYDPVVTASDGDGRLHWADNDYVLVFNGDLVDRGPANDEVLELVVRLVDEAPPGRVRVTLGNHEAIALSPDHFGFGNWYSGRVDTEGRLALLDAITAGHVVAAYEGHTLIYAHAGSSEPYSADAVNDELVGAAAELREAAGTLDDTDAQRWVLEEYSRVLGVGDRDLKGPGAGLVWLDFAHLAADAQPQVVGHTRHRRPTSKGAVHCQNVIRNNLGGRGGECVFVETPDSLSALVRESDDGVRRSQLVGLG